MNITSPIDTLYVMEIALGAERERETKYLPPQRVIVQIGNYFTETAYTGDGCDGEYRVKGFVVCSKLVRLPNALALIVPLPEGF